MATQLDTSLAVVQPSRASSTTAHEILDTKSESPTQIEDNSDFVIDHFEEGDPENPKVRRFYIAKAKVANIEALELVRKEKMVPDLYCWIASPERVSPS